MLRVDRDRFQEMVGHAEQEYPYECCGILLGRRSGGDRAVERVFPAANVATERRRDRFEMDPKAILAADRLARDSSLEVVGFYHSHPDHPPIASATDNDRARPGWHDGYSFLILSVDRGRFSQARSWTLDTERLVEEDLALVDPAPNPDPSRSASLSESKE